jgi:hypothetical protein
MGLEEVKTKNPSNFNYTEEIKKGDCNEISEANLKP